MNEETPRNGILLAVGWRSNVDVVVNVMDAVDGVDVVIDFEVTLVIVFMAVVVVVDAVIVVCIIVIVVVVVGIIVVVVVAVGIVVFVERFYLRRFLSCRRAAIREKKEPI